MLKAPDVADLWHLGWLPAQHFDPGYDVHLRTAMFMARISRDADHVFNRNVPLPGTRGDVLGFSLWGVAAKQRDGATATGPGAAVANASQATRPIPAWAAAWAAVTTQATDDSDDQAIPQSSGGRTQERAAANASAATVRPVFSRSWDADPRFLEKGAATPPGWPGLPKNWPGIVLVGTKEDSQEDLFLPLGGGPLVAINFAGDPTTASLVCDELPDGKIDKARRARLHSMMRVVRLLAAGKNAGNGIAWNLAPAGQDRIDGGGLMIDLQGPTVSPAQPPSISTTSQPTTTGTQEKPFIKTTQAFGVQATGFYGTRLQDGRKHPQTKSGNGGPNSSTTGLAVAYMSRRFGGIVDVGDAHDIHRFGTTLDGEPENPAHVSTEVILRGPEGDAGLALEPNPYQPVKSYPFLSPVHFRFRAAGSHRFRGRILPGDFAWQAEVPDYPPATDSRITTYDDG